MFLLRFVITSLSTFTRRNSVPNHGADCNEYFLIRCVLQNRSINGERLEQNPIEFLRMFVQQKTLGGKLLIRLLRDTQTHGNPRHDIIIRLPLVNHGPPACVVFEFLRPFANDSARQGDPYTFVSVRLVL